MRDQCRLLVVGIALVVLLLPESTTAEGTGDEVTSWLWSSVWSSDTSSSSSPSLPETLRRVPFWPWESESKDNDNNDRDERVTTTSEGRNDIHDDDVDLMNAGDPEEEEEEEDKDDVYVGDEEEQEEEEPQEAQPSRLRTKRIDGGHRRGPDGEGVDRKRTQKDDEDAVDFNPEELFMAEKAEDDLEDDVDAAKWGGVVFREDDDYSDNLGPTHRGLLRFTLDGEPLGTNMDGYRRYGSSLDYTGPDKNETVQLDVFQTEVTIRGEVSRAFRMDTYDISDATILEFDFRANTPATRYEFCVDRRRDYTKYSSTGDNCFYLYTDTQERALLEWSGFVLGRPWTLEVGRFYHFKFRIGHYTTQNIRWIAFRNGEAIPSATGQPGAEPSATFKDIQFYVDPDPNGLNVRLGGFPDGVVTNATDERLVTLKGEPRHYGTQINLYHPTKNELGRLGRRYDRGRTDQYQMSDDGSSITLRGNAWKAWLFGGTKAAPLRYTLTQETVMEFTVDIIQETDLHAVCLDDRIHENFKKRYFGHIATRCVHVGGLEARSKYRLRPDPISEEPIELPVVVEEGNAAAFVDGDGTTVEAIRRRYKVRVGRFIASGDVMYLGFIQDTNSLTRIRFGHSVISNIRIYEAPVRWNYRVVGNGTSTDVESQTVVATGGPAQPYSPYDGYQEHYQYDIRDTTFQFSEAYEENSPPLTALTVYGNAWKRFDLGEPYKVQGNTVFEFDLYVRQEAEAHAICLAEFPGDVDSCFYLGGSNITQADFNKRLDSDRTIEFLRSLVHSEFNHVDNTTSHAIKWSNETLTFQIDADTTTTAEDRTGAVAQYEDDGVRGPGWRMRVEVGRYLTFREGATYIAVLGSDTSFWADIGEITIDNVLLYEDDTIPRLQASIMNPNDKSDVSPRTLGWPVPLAYLEDKRSGPWKYALSEDATALSLFGNIWRAFPLPEKIEGDDDEEEEFVYQLTSQTVVEFDVFITTEAEEHAVCVTEQLGGFPTRHCVAFAGTAEPYNATIIEALWEEQQAEFEASKEAEEEANNATLTNSTDEDTDGATAFGRSFSLDRSRFGQAWIGTVEEADRPQVNVAKRMTIPIGQFLRASFRIRYLAFVSDANKDHSKSGITVSNIRLYDDSSLPLEEIPSADDAANQPQTQPKSTSNDGDDGPRIGVGAVVGIAIGCLFVLGLIILCVFCITRRSQPLGSNDGGDHHHVGGEAPYYS